MRSRTRPHWSWALPGSARSYISTINTTFHESCQHKDSLSFSVSKKLTKFPFGVLPFKGKPLIRHVAVSQVPSLVVLERLSKQSGPPSIAPTVSAYNAPDIEMVAEAIHISGIPRYFFSSPVTMTAMSRADFFNCIQQDASAIIHICSHGQFKKFNPPLFDIHDMWGGTDRELYVYSPKDGQIGSFLKMRKRTW